ncbi:hypothetical protein LCGC14_0353450 [marine sediment metagenome]|uniref:DnaA N-terminal domain-containing protein n=1 Tax=marine sediment metagenome TaxID=412755 RepID=A0A0F9WI68_9ZZZZ
MSITLISEVWKCDLPPNLSHVLLSMADIADDDGSRCYPSIAHLAWKCGYSSRQIQRTIQELREREILLVVAHDTGGRGNATEYLIKLDHVERKIPWEIVRVRHRQKGDTTSPLSNSKGDILDEKGCHAAQVKGDTLDTKGRHMRHERVTPTSPHPLVTVIDPLHDPLSKQEGEKDKREPPEYKFWDAVLGELQLVVTRPTFATWLKDTRCISVSHDIVVIEVANTFVRDRLRDQMYSMIDQAARQISPDIKEILFEVAQPTESS